MLILTLIVIVLTIIMVIILISNGNWTEWSTIQGVVRRVTVIPELYDTKSNYQLIVSIIKCKNVHYTGKSQIYSIQVASSGEQAF